MNQNKLLGILIGLSVIFVCLSFVFYQRVQQVPIDQLSNRTKLVIDSPWLDDLLAQWRKIRQ